jgi:hypothetical protein
MKRSFILAFLILNYACSIGQFSYFNNRYNNDFLSSGKAIFETETGYIIVGVSGFESNDYLFLKLVVSGIDFKGNQQWWKTYGEDFHNYYAGNMRSADRTSDGGFILAGSIEDTIRTVGLLVKIDQNGDSLWSRIYGDTISPYFTGSLFRVCRQLSNQGYILAGSRFISEDDADILLMRTDSVGNTIWQQVYGQLHIIEEAFSIAELSDGGFIIGYSKEDINWLNSADPGILRVDSIGKQVWMKTFGSTMDEWGCAVTTSKDGNYLFGTTYAISEPGPGDPLQKARILKIDNESNIIWEKKYGDVLFTGGSCTIDELSDGTIIESGDGGFEDCMSIQGWILKAKPNGDSIWFRRYNYYPLTNAYLNYLYDITITSDNGIILTGEVLGEPEWEQSIWVQKLDSLGCDSVRCDTTVSISEYNPIKFSQANIIIYPNPASDWITILINDNIPSWCLERKLVLTNILGEKVIEKEIPRSSKSLELGISAFPTGIYIVTVFERQRLLYSSKILISR